LSLLESLLFAHLKDVRQEGLFCNLLKTFLECVLSGLLAGLLGTVDDELLNVLSLCFLNKFTIKILRIFFLKKESLIFGMDFKHGNML